MNYDIHEKARAIVTCYLLKQGNQDETMSVKTHVESHHCVLGNLKWQISATLAEIAYRFDVAFNAARNEFWLDVYKLTESRCITV